MLSPESESDVDSSDGGNGPSLNSEGVRSGSVPQKRGVIRNNLEDGEVENSESDPDVKQSRKRHRVSSGDKRANAGDSVRYLVDDEAEESGDEAHSDDGEESGEFVEVRVVSLSISRLANYYYHYFVTTWYGGIIGLVRLDYYHV